MLSPAARRRYTRHLLLSEIGEAGQERLCAAQVRAAPAADARAAEVALDYLARAGLGVSADGAQTATAIALLLPSPEQLRGLAGDAALEEAAAALSGAFAAVEAIKQALGVGSPAALPVMLAPPAGKAKP